MADPEFETVAPAAVIQRAYRIALDPAPAQERLLRSNCGAARVAYNTLLARVKANLDQRSAEKSYGFAGDDLTQSMSWSKFSLGVEWNRIKAEVAPWWSENSKEAYRHGANCLAAALKNFVSSKAGVRAGAAVGFPTFKSRNRSKPSVKFEGGNVRLESAGHGVVLPRIGRIHTHQSTRAISRLVEAGLGKVHSVAVSYTRGRWVASFQVEQRNPHRRPEPKRGVPQSVGIDIGVKDLIVVATPAGVEVERIRAPHALAHAQAQMRTLQRKAARQVGPWDPETRTRRAPSAGWRHTQDRIRRAHARVANLRADHMHKATTRLAKTHTLIGVEDLNVTGMLQRSKPKPDPDNPGRFLRNNRAGKRGLSRAIADASFGEVLRQLDYKTVWYGARAARVGRFFPSSKMCSGCGAVKAKLRLSERTYVCTGCGMVLDRDLNAAVNIAREAQRLSEQATSVAPGAGSALVSGGGHGKTYTRLRSARGHGPAKPQPHQNHGDSRAARPGQYRPAREMSQVSRKLTPMEPFIA